MNRLSSNVLSFLKNTASHIEELQVQTTLGKAELASRLEAIKREASVKLHQLKVEVEGLMQEDKATFQELKSKIEYLEAQLSSTGADTIDALRQQKQSIKSTVQKMEEIVSEKV